MVSSRRVAGGQRARRLVAIAAGIVVMALALSSCSWVQGLFGGSKVDKGAPVSVFDVAVGDCFLAPTKEQAELSDLQRVPCTVAHQQEAYAIVTYQSTDQSGAYPGDSVLDDFAKGACAQAYTGYVGISYLDSSLWYTYLLPSARSWQQDNDRTVLCFVTTTGQSLTKSVKGSKL